MFRISDIDECETKKPCWKPELCNNTEGSYKCLCEDGSLLDDDGHTCIGKCMKCTINYSTINCKHIH